MATIFGLICDGTNCSADPNKSNEWVNFAKQKIISSSKPKQKPTRCHFKNCNFYFVTSTEKGLRLQIANCRRTLPLKSWPTLRFLQEIIHCVKIYKLCCLTSFSFLIETLLNQCPPVVLETICFKPLMAGHENIKKYSPSLLKMYRYTNQIEWIFVVVTRKYRFLIIRDGYISQFFPNT